jgi:hypothetical protein
MTEDFMISQSMQANNLRYARTTFLKILTVDLILPAALGPPPLTELSTRNLLGGKGQPAHKVDTLTAICEPNV